MSIVHEDVVHKDVVGVSACVSLLNQDSQNSHSILGGLVPKVLFLSNRDKERGGGNATAIKRKWERFCHR